MGEIPIQEEHQQYVARLQHTLEWLAGERARLEGELAAILVAGKKAQSEMLTFLHRSYSVLPASVAAVNAERNVVTLHDPDPPAVPSGDSERNE